MSRHEGTAKPAWGGMPLECCCWSYSLYEKVTHKVTHKHAVCPCCAVYASSVGLGNAGQLLGDRFGRHMVRASSIKSMLLLRRHAQAEGANA